MNLHRVGEVLAHVYRIGAVGLRDGDRAAGSTATCALSSLFERSGSDELALTVAEFRSVPVWVGWTTTVTVALASAASEPMAQLTIPANSSQLPWLVVADWNEAPAGSASSTSTSAASPGPLLVATIV